MLNFRQWLEDVGPVSYDRLSDEEESPYRTKYVSAKQDKKKSHDPDKVFGKSKRKMKKNG